MNRIKELREEIGMTQVRLSIELEVAQETVSAYERNRHYPSVSALIKMMDIFDASIDYILGFSDVRKSVEAISEKEKLVLSRYNSLTPANRNSAMVYLKGLYDAQKNAEK